MKPQSDQELVLEFCVELSRRMILSGANIERVQLAVERICSTYQFSEISLFLLSDSLSLSAMDQNGQYAARQCTIPPAGIHLDRLRSLNRLSYEVAHTKPAPRQLRQMLLG